ncbi:hypothetical protein [Flaviflexus equikiangi]|uniref:Uncharacterized protein n=1 Tax=Flaviflexus equikiangi TaxID=2758573 RepID=A0ABS2TCC0_9ACTO|nr:hypothetical protein [Flaviflexus equikiangi]MBM9432279.1 hypothetical protein [Flaviflexus equikiangi]
MSNSKRLAELVGQVALAQAEIDEWLVQVLISLLRPLPDSRVQLLVSRNSLDQKCKLIRDLTEDQEYAIDERLGSGQTLREILSRIKTLNDERDRAVHSYYDCVNENQIRQFRSRQPEAKSVSIAELESLTEKLSQCVDALRGFVDHLESRYTRELEVASLWGDVLRGVHEVIVAGHLHERNQLEDLRQAMDTGGPIRLAINRTKRTFLAEGIASGENEFLVEIAPSNWLATVRSPAGEKVQFGDTGWRNVTDMAQEDDPTIRFAAIRRVANEVLCSIEGGELTAATWPTPRDRLAERAFGPSADNGSEFPSWLIQLEGFSPIERTS